MKLLALDVGNTNISVGFFSGRRLVSVRAWPTAKAEGIGAVLPRAEQAILVSVVPAATRRLVPVLKRRFKKPPLVVGRHLQAPILNRYRVPSQVGQDRLVNGAAAYARYGGPVIVVDFGTAVTIDLVSGRREYRGGVIVPGIRVGMKALVDRAALLPEVKLLPPKQILGRDTQGSMRSGIFFGYSALCDGLVQRLKRKYAPSARVVATGGDAKQFAPYCRTIREVNPHLTLQGLELTYRTSGVGEANPRG